MLDALLANVLSSAKEAAAFAPPVPPAAVVPVETSANPPPILKVTQDRVRKTAPAPARPNVPRRVVWQLYCQGDGRLYYHADKAYLERWVADRNVLYANARAALPTTPRTFYSTVPGFGFQAGGCAGGSCRR